MYKLFGKRLFDIIVVCCALILLLPALIFLYFLVKIKLGSPVFFIHERQGFQGQSFKLIKFRTMTDRRNQDGELLSDAERITSFGQFMRSASLDELPELLNILGGTMSLVGPRPLLMKYIPLYTQEEARRLSVMPGLTGWAQVNGRNAISWEDKFCFDNWYVDNSSFGLDLKILFLTVLRVCKRSDINNEENITDLEFSGTDKGKLLLKENLEL